MDFGETKFQLNSGRELYTLQWNIFPEVISFGIDPCNRLNLCLIWRTHTHLRRWKTRFVWFFIFRFFFTCVNFRRLIWKRIGNGISVRLSMLYNVAQTMAVGATTHGATRCKHSPHSSSIPSVLSRMYVCIYTGNGRNKRATQRRTMRITRRYDWKCLAPICRRAKYLCHSWKK